MTDFLTFLIPLTGATATLATIVAFQMTSIRALLVLNGCAAALMGVHLLAQGAISGGIIDLGGAATLFFQAALGHRLALCWRVAATVPVIVCAIVLREAGVQAWLPVAGIALGRLAEAWADPIRTRVGVVVSYVPWVGYAVLSATAWGMVYTGLAATAAGWGIVRVRRREEHQIPQNITGPYDDARPGRSRSAGIRQTGKLERTIRNGATKSWGAAGMRGVIGKSCSGRRNTRSRRQ